tara:strand:+ start:360 stop:956 length:597 start_codon:yes stop_codon:yes gene_type:complete
MKKVTAFLILSVFLSNVSFSQQGTKLYKNLIEGMSIKDAKKEIKKNKSDYNEVSFGNGFQWTIKSTGLIKKDKKSDALYGVFLWPKGTLLSGLGYDGTVNYLNASSKFFLDRGYTELLKNQWWNAPQNFTTANYKYGLVLLSPDKTRVVHLYPVDMLLMDGKTKTNQAYIKLFSKGAWDEMMEEEDQKKSQDTSNTDF